MTNVPPEGHHKLISCPQIQFSTAFWVSGSTGAESHPRLEEGATTTLAALIYRK